MAYNFNICVGYSHKRACAKKFNTGEFKLGGSVWDAKADCQNAKLFLAIRCNYDCIVFSLRI